MKLSTNEKIFTENGQHIGNLTRFVLDPKTKQVALIVFKRGMLEPVEYVFPIEWIDHVDDGIHLKTLPVNNVDNFTRFKEDEYIITDEHALTDKGYVSEDMVSNYYFYPSLPFGAPGVMHPTETYTNRSSTVAPSPAQMGIPEEGEEPMIVETHENIPAGDVALKEGAKVYSSDDKHLGNVDKLVMDPNNNKVSHLVVSKGVLLKERKAIPVDWVDEITADDVYLSVKSDLMDRLPDFHENM